MSGAAGPRGRRAAGNDDAPPPPRGATAPPPLRTGIVLAGGAGRRIGGAKALVPFRGKPLIAWSLDALAPVCDELLVAHGTTLDARLAAVVGDRARLVPDDGHGPLSGALAAAGVARGETILLAPCDTPFLTREVYDELLASMGRRDGAMASAGGVPNPLVSALRRETAIVALRSAAWTGERSLLAALRTMDVALVPMAEQDVADVDTREDAERLE